MPDEKAKPRDARPPRAPELDPQVVAQLKSRFGDEVVDVLRLDEGVLDRTAIYETAKAVVEKRREATSFNQVALERRIYENEIVRQDAEIFRELALLVRSIGDRYRALTGLPPVQRR